MSCNSREESPSCVYCAYHLMYVGTDANPNFDEYQFISKSARITGCLVTCTACYWVNFTLAVHLQVCLTLGFVPLALS